MNKPLLNKYLKKYGGDLLKELANKGTVKKTPKLMKEFNALPAQEDESDQNIQYRVDRLIALAKKCKGVITITDDPPDMLDEEIYAHLMKISKFRENPVNIGFRRK